jgi:hypothetical protein
MVLPVVLPVEQMIRTRNSCAYQQIVLNALPTDVVLRLETRNVSTMNVALVYLTVEPQMTTAWFRKIAKRTLESALLI